MKRKSLRLEIKRRKSAAEAPYWQCLDYEIQDEKETVASVLTRINDEADFLDCEGNLIEPIGWECSCLQKKCGACAMVINGKPRLACDSFLKDYRKKITIEPLQKFPAVRDLIVDRSILAENLKEMKLWMSAEGRVTDRTGDIAYESSRCLQCGCCLEVCPNYCVGEAFYGAAGFVPSTRLLSLLSGEERESIKEAYLTHEYRGCGKSLACAKVCPAGIDMEKMLIHSAEIAFRKR